MKKNILIAYFSHSANTHNIAKLIQAETGGILHEIMPEKAYPTSYNAMVDQAKKEIQAGYKPALKSKIDHIDAYDTIFVGSPNWWSTIAPPIATFLSENDFDGKTIVPFCTHGGGGQARVLKDIAKLCPNSTVLAGFDIFGDGGSGAKTKVAAWLYETGIA
ncbi:MAG TPA: flavodoxin [Desulfosporosinus sp.]|nr:flavodoxin [Desulfosporosinus sp.]